MLVGRRARWRERILTVAFSAPLGLLALLALPAVLALHMFRRRYRPRRVAGAFLFLDDALAASAGRMRTPLVRSPSLWLELAAATALALWLAGPQLWQPTGAGHLVAVLDDSASMGAVGRDGRTFADRAREAVAEELARVGGEARVTLMTTGQRPRVILGPAAPGATAAPALRDWTPRRGWHRADAALALAREIGGPAATLLFVTDGEAAAPRAFRVRAVGEALDNAALVHARRVPREGGERLLVDATALARGALQRTLAVRARGEGTELATRTVELASDRLARFELDLPATAGAVEVFFESDALALDDRIVLLPEPPRRVAVAVALPADLARLLQLGHALRALGSGVRLDGAAPDLEITDAPRDGGWTTQLVIAAGQEPFAAWVGPFLLERRHPLLRGVTLEGVIWSAGEPQAAGRGLVYANDHALLAEEVLGERARVTLNLRAVASNLHTSPDWPILLSNLVEQTRVRLPGAAEVNVRLGEPIVWRRPPDEPAGTELRLVGPHGHTIAGFGRGAVTFETETAGEHRLLRGDDELQRYAVHFADARESDLRACSTATVEPVPSAREAAGTESLAPRGAQERLVLAFLLLILVVLDWLVLSRRLAFAHANASNTASEAVGSIVSQPLSRGVASG